MSSIFLAWEPDRFAVFFEPLKDGGSSGDGRGERVSSETSRSGEPCFVGQAAERSGGDEESRRLLAKALHEQRSVALHQRRQAFGDREGAVRSPKRRDESPEARVRRGEEGVGDLVLAVAEETTEHLCGVRLGPERRARQPLGGEEHSRQDAPQVRHEIPAPHGLREIGDRFDSIGRIGRQGPGEERRRHRLDHSPFGLHFALFAIRPGDSIEGLQVGVNDLDPELVPGHLRGDGPEPWQRCCVLPEAEPEAGIVVLFLPERLVGCEVGQERIVGKVEARLGLPEIEAGIALHREREAGEQIGHGDAARDGVKEAVVPESIGLLGRELAEPGEISRAKGVRSPRVGARGEQVSGEERLIGLGLGSEAAAPEDRRARPGCGEERAHRREQFGARVEAQLLMEREGLVHLCRGRFEAGGEEVSPESIRVDPLAEPTDVVEEVRIHAGAEGFAQRFQPIFTDASRD